MTTPTIGPKPAALNFRIRQGSTFGTTLTYRDSDSNAVDLTGYTARMQIREELSSPSTLLSLTDVDGLTLGGS